MNRFLLLRRLSILVWALCLEGTLSLSTTPWTTAKRKTSPSRKTAKAWRYAQPKSSRWDIRHTKSFRFEIRAPSLSPKNNSQKQEDDCWDAMPLHKKPKESLSHVIGKGLLWSLFKDDYGSLPGQTILVETPLFGEPRFVPDVVALEEGNTVPTFWGESGRMSVDKAVALAEKYPHTHFVHLRWGSAGMETFFEEIETAVLPTLHHRTAPFEFGWIEQEPKQFLAEDGTVLLRKEDVQWRRAGFDIDLNY